MSQMQHSACWSSGETVLALCLLSSNNIHNESFSTYSSISDYSNTNSISFSYQKLG